VLIEVVDARDPLGCRCADVERFVRRLDPSKKIVLLLNKIGAARLGGARGSEIEGGERCMPLLPRVVLDNRAGRTRVRGQRCGWDAGINAGPQPSTLWPHPPLPPPDLVPREVAEAWLKYFREELPAVAFKSSTQKQVGRWGGQTAATSSSTGWGLWVCSWGKGMLALSSGCAFGGPLPRLGSQQEGPRFCSTTC
jgi:hypothetical protein